MAFYRLTYRFVGVTGEEGNFTLHVSGAAGASSALAVIAGDAGTLL